MSEAVQVIQNLELPDMSSLTSTTTHELQESTDVTSAAIVGGQALAFLPGLNPQQTDDIFHSLLFAQLAASKKYNRFTQAESWYDSYVSILGTAGWRMMPFVLQTYDAAQSSGCSDETLSALFRKALSEPAFSAFSSFHTELRNLSPEEKLPTVFRTSAVLNNATSPPMSHKANFQFGVAYESPETRGPAINLGAFVYKTSSPISNPVWHHWGSKPVEFKYAIQTIVLNERVYGYVRELIMARLRNHGHLIAPLHSLESFEEIIHQRSFAQRALCRLAALNTRTQQVPEGAVTGGQLVAFMPGVTTQQMDDINNSCLYAQLKASEKYNRRTQIGDWYIKYVSVLKDLGWVVDKFSFVEFKNAQRLGSTNKTVLTNLAEKMSGPGFTLFKDLFDRFARLKEEDGPRKILEAHGCSNYAANFQLGVAYPLEGGKMGLDLGAYTLSVRDQKIHHLLWFEWGDHKVKFEGSMQKLSLNEAAYSKVRESIADDLGSKASAFIATIDNI